MTTADVNDLADMVSYQPGSVVSRKILGGKGGNVTLFAFAEGEGLTEHTSPYEALVVILDGEARVRVGETGHTLGTGQAMTLPASVRPGRGRAVQDDADDDPRSVDAQVEEPGAAGVRADPQRR